MWPVDGIPGYDCIAKKYGVVVFDSGPVWLALLRWDKLRPDYQYSPQKSQWNDNVTSRMNWPLGNSTQNWNSFDMARWYLTKTIRRCCYSFALEAQSRVQLSITSRKCFIVRYLNNIVHFYHTYRIGVTCNSFAFNKRPFFPMFTILIASTVWHQPNSSPVGVEYSHFTGWNNQITCLNINEWLTCAGWLFTATPHPSPSTTKKKISALCGAGLMIDYMP